jgi:hypothetical protein
MEAEVEAACELVPQPDPRQRRLLDLHRLPIRHILI